MLNIVLLEPEIPANTGNIGRTCVAAGARLHLIEPMGFQINEKQVKRAGLDYWDKLDYTIYDSFPDFLEKNPGAKIYMATTKAKHVYSDVKFEEDCYIMFGKESAGIPEEIKTNWEPDWVCPSARRSSPPTNRIWMWSAPKALVPNLSLH